MTLDKKKALAGVALLIMQLLNPPPPPGLSWLYEYPLVIWAVIVALLLPAALEYAKKGILALAPRSAIYLPIQQNKKSRTWIRAKPIVDKVLFWGSAAVVSISLLYWWQLWIWGNELLASGRGRGEWREFVYHLDEGAPQGLTLGQCPSRCFSFRLEEIISREGRLFQPIVFAGEGIGLVGDQLGDQVSLKQTGSFGVSNATLGASPALGTVQADLLLRESAVFVACSTVYDVRVAMTSLDVNSLELTLWVRRGTFPAIRPARGRAACNIEGFLL